MFKSGLHKPGSKFVCIFRYALMISSNWLDKNIYFQRFPRLCDISEDAHRPS